ncbi:hypothetical protein [Sulfurovum sp. AR]|uniref:hypothetical protein n=1 Tax=Sulfurovum sp. AR TaxID=1165841 RepID=UPI00025C47CB|nr:hypothetical protein [Sulfurovum sp. AR]EIF50713.1 hypothetical protein SULAR_05073 [Sulfurovum sp. AR]
MTKEINPDLQKIIRVLKNSGNTIEDISNSQLSDIAGLNRKYIQRNKLSIQAYYDTAAKATKSDYTFFSNRNIDVYMNIAFNKKDKFIYRDTLGAVVGYLLKWEYNLLAHIQKNTKVIEIGKAVTELICLIESKKDTSKGTPIHSQSKSVKTLFKSNKLKFIDELFIRTNGYYAGYTSKKWKLTNLSTKVIEQAIDILLDRIHLVHIQCPTNCATYSSICSPLHGTPIDLSIVKTLNLSSILHILNMSVGYNPSTNELLVSMEHTSTTDETLGRNYNLFCRLRSYERLKFGYINYDISAALQTICLQLIGASKSDYPILTSYSTDKAFKTSLRSSIACDSNIPIDEVKAKLTAFANGGISGKDKHPMYMTFQEESDRLRREVIAYTAKHNPLLLEKAKKQSKRTLSEDIDWFDLSPEYSHYVARNKASVFFFVWTYYERVIRKAMLKCFPDGIEVHDAVYSKERIDTKIIEQKVFENTGFNVQISTD